MYSLNGFLICFLSIELLALTFQNIRIRCLSKTWSKLINETTFGVFAEPLERWIQCLVVFVPVLCLRISILIEVMFRTSHTWSIFLSGCLFVSLPHSYFPPNYISTPTLISSALLSLTTSTSVPQCLSLVQCSSVRRVMETTDRVFSSEIQKHGGRHKQLILNVKHDMLIINLQESPGISCNE